jgi:thiamine-monophosphate kinase
MSDEATRLGRIVEPVFGQQQGWSFATGDFQIRLEGGVEKQDDAAWYRIAGDAQLVFASDFIRGDQFDLFSRGILSYFDLGYYLAAANLSDIAAMGAQPVGITSVVRYPPSLSDGELEEILIGVRDGSAASDCLNVGGDIGSSDHLVLSASAIGIAGVGQVLKRSGAQVGDALMVSGPVGTAGASRKYFTHAGKLERLPEYLEVELAQSWRRPTAQIELGRALSTNRWATSAQDVSDGLRQAVESLAKQSSVGIRLDLDAVPIRPVVHAVAQLLEVDVAELALGASVDFSLLFTAPQAAVGALRDTFPQSTVIGEVVGDSFVGAFAERSGKRMALPGIIFAHD